MFSEGSSGVRLLVGHIPEARVEFPQCIQISKQFLVLYFPAFPSNFGFTPSAFSLRSRCMVGSPSTYPRHEGILHCLYYLFPAPRCLGCTTHTDLNPNDRTSTTVHCQHYALRFPHSYWPSRPHQLHPPQNTPLSHNDHYSAIFFNGLPFTQCYRHNQWLLTSNASRQRLALLPTVLFHAYHSSLYQ